MEFEDIEPVFYEDDLEEFERNQLANDRACERNDEEPLDGEVDDFGDLIDAGSASHCLGRSGPTREQVG